MKIIEKKILPFYFSDVLNESKQFEIRKDEDGISVGDLLVLNEWSPDCGYSGRSAVCHVLYILRNVPEYGLSDGYCIIGFNLGAVDEY